MSITIYGASDDGIVVSGDISEEFDAIDRLDGGFLAFSDGTILRIRFNADGIWRITPESVPDAELLTITQCPTGDGESYSDRAELRADIDWVAYAQDVAHNKH